MNVITYTVHLLEPLLATRIDGDPNSGVSYPYIPGSLVRGALAGAYQRSLHVKSLDAADPLTRKLFFDGHTRYLNAYPVAPAEGGKGDSGSARLLPTPLSWHVEKGIKTHAYDFAVQVPAPPDGERTVVQYKAVQPSQPFCLRMGQELVTISPERQVTVHTARDRIYGRARQGSGAVFQYDALAPGQVLRGVILVEDEGADELQRLLETITTLGGSANSGYGRVKIGDIAAHSVEPGAWREIGGVTKPVAAGEPFIVTLLSDAILRDRTTGLPGVDLCAELGALLNAKIATAKLADRRSAIRMGKTGGFNRRWGLPLVQTQCLAAGSVWVVTADKDLGAAAQQALELRGIGERRSEGFGRLAFQWQGAPVAGVTELDATALASASNGGSSPAAAAVLTGDALKLGARLAERLLREDLDTALQRKVNELSVTGSPSMAQLSRLRVIARDALPAGNVPRLLHYVEDLERRKSSRDQLRRAKIGEIRLGVWLKDLLAAPESIWSVLGNVPSTRQIGANVAAHADAKLANEYTIRLIDAVFAKAAQDRRQQEDNR